MPAQTKFQFRIFIARQAVHSQSVGFLQDAFGSRDDSKSPLVYGQLTVDDIAYELEFGVPHGIHDRQNDRARFVQV